MQRTKLTDDYSISKVIKGGWQLAGGHGQVDRNQAIADMFTYYEAGITTFDCADIYTGVEELIGSFLKRLRTERGANEASKVQVHTKYVPDRQDLGKLTPADVERAIRRSINRLGVEKLDLVQFHWWDFSVKQYIEVAMMLGDLQQKGLIRHIGLTNFDPIHIEELAEAGVKTITDQVQYSVLDHRPEKSLQAYCSGSGMTMLCYGGLAGGFIGERYLGVPEPTLAELQDNRSLIKYKLIIDDLGGWTSFQKLLEKLSEVGKSRGLTISEVALLYVLSKPNVGAVIVGARNSSHIKSFAKLTKQSLAEAETAEINNILGLEASLNGDIYELERTDEKHVKIMKYNLNKE
jgi:aryl-alcohol dehydrogenase-like predicted oxidoreductase